MRRRRGRTAGRSGGSRWLRLVGPLAFGAIATLASSAVDQRARARYPDIDACVTGCDVAAVGWPLPYVVDYPGLSPGNEASLGGVLVGVDRLRPEALALDLAGWMVVAAVVAALVRRLRR